MRDIFLNFFWIWVSCGQVGLLVIKSNVVVMLLYFVLSEFVMFLELFDVFGLDFS
jgi:hypothetical protein